MTKITTLGDFAKNVRQDSGDKKFHAYLCIQDETEVSYGFENDCDLAYCEAHNIPTFDRTGNGGCIVHAKGNIGFAVIYPNFIYGGFLCQNKFPIDFIEYLKMKGIEATTEHNDILIDDFKVASAAGVNLPPDFKWTFESIQISINQDLDIIEHVCKKPMVKIPRGLSHYGITTEEVEGWLDNWVKENFDEKRAD